jgi:hypothetical protein
MRARAFALLVVLGLSGCALTPAISIPGATIAGQAEEALASQIDNFTIDCGEDAVSLVDGATVDCVLSDSAGATYAAVVTISGVNGVQYQIDVQVPDLFHAGAESVDSDGSMTATPVEIATVASGALAPQLGFQPVVTCAEGITIAVDNAVRCEIADVDGTVATVLITITSVNGNAYAVTAEVD